MFRRSSYEPRSYGLPRPVSILSFVLFAQRGAAGRFAPLASDDTASTSRASLQRFASRKEGLGRGCRYRGDERRWSANRWCRGAIIVGAHARLPMPAHLNPRSTDTMSATSPALSAATLDILRHVSTATLTTQLFKRGLRNTFMQGVAPLGSRRGANLVGPAFTLRNIPSREDIDVLELFADPLSRNKSYSAVAFTLSPELIQGGTQAWRRDV
ncbi:hypothetical protein OKW30_006273 [Paraburkholderia sp. Clong3]